MLIDNNSFQLYYNSLYWFVALSVILSASYCEFKGNISIINKISYYLTYFPLLILILITGLRSYVVGTDTGNYYYLLWQQKPEVTFNNEFVFQLIAVSLQYFYVDYTCFLILISILFFSFIYKALKNYTLLYKANILMVLFSFMSFFFFLSMSINVIRQGVSLAILLYAFTLLLKKDSKIKVLIYSLIAIAFHLTSIIPILIISLAYYLSSKNNQFIYSLLILYFLIFVLAYFNIGLLNISPYVNQLLGNDGRSGYLSGETFDYVVGFKPQFVVFNTFFILISLYIRKNLTDFKLKTQYNIILIYFIIASCLLFLAFQLPFSDRWGLFSWIVVPFLITPLFYSPYLKGKIRIHYILMLILIFIGFKFYAK